MTRLTAGSAALELDPSAGGRVSQLVIDGLEILAHTGTNATPMGKLRDGAVGWPDPARSVRFRRHDLPVTD